MRMKKMLILALITLFYIVSSALVPPQTVPVDKDVGITCVITDIHQMQTPVIAPCEMNYQLARGVSVPDKGLISSDAITYDNQESFTCNTYYTIDRLDLKLPTLAGFENQIDKYPFASDLGLRSASQNGVTFRHG